MQLISTSELNETFPKKSIITAYRKPNSLKDILAPSKFGKQECTGRTSEGRLF